MAKAVRMADIAKRLNVSTVTVSKALSDQKGVSGEMREKIKQLADELGYVPPSAGHRAKEHKSYNIGVIIAERFLDEGESFYGRLYRLVTTKAISRGGFTMLEIVGKQEEEGIKLPKLLQEKKTDGLVVIGRMNTEYLAMINEKGGIPVVYMDFYDEKNPCDAVIPDSFYGMYHMVNYLFEMGHERIAYVGTLLSAGDVTDRYFGYAKSLLEHGQEVRKDWVIDDRRPETGKTDSGKLLRLPEEMPTAFACSSDFTAHELIKKLKAEGYRVPEDISVVGYNNYLYPGLSDVGITTYEVDMKEMAGRAIHIILRKISGDNCRGAVNVVAGRPIYRESVLRR